ncbi:MAG: hypothetical protein ACYDH9_11810 [Limisphaerales bacterium]
MPSHQAGQQHAHDNIQHHVKRRSDSFRKKREQSDLQQIRADRYGESGFDSTSANDVHIPGTHRAARGGREGLYRSGSLPGDHNSHPPGESDASQFLASQGKPRRNPEGFNVNGRGRQPTGSGSMRSSALAGPNAFRYTRRPCDPFRVAAGLERKNRGLHPRLLRFQPCGLAGLLIRRAARN